jgi:hypothetical protein
LALLEAVPIEDFDRFLGFFVRSHLDETETPGVAGELVADDADRMHLSGLLK